MSGYQLSSYHGNISHVWTGDDFVTLSGHFLPNLPNRLLTLDRVLRLSLRPLSVLSVLFLHLSPLGLWIIRHIQSLDRYSLPTPSLPHFLTSSLYLTFPTHHSINTQFVHSCACSSLTSPALLIPTSVAALYEKPPIVLVLSSFDCAPNYP